MSCWGGQDHEGRAMPDMCMPSKGTPDGCPAECPTPSCGRNEMPCQDMPTNGCPSKGYCMPFEATSKCNAYCPVNCGPEEMHCPGEEDHMGCKMPDSCIPSKNGDCPAFCPVHCKENEMMCGMMPDTNGCPSKGWCMHHDDTAICKDTCPVQCGPDDMVCPGGMDSMGCKMPDTCMPSKDTCPPV